MKWNPVSRDELPVSGRPSSQSATLFQEFMNSADELWEIELDSDDKTVESKRSSLDNYVVRHDLPVKVFTRGGRLFIEEADTRPSERPKRPRKAKATDNGAEAPVAAAEEPLEGEYAGI